MYMCIYGLKYMKSVMISSVLYSLPILPSDPLLSFLHTDKCGVPIH